MIEFHKGKHIETGADGYILDEDFEYFSLRYKRWIYLKEGMWSDGATGFVDLGTGSIVPRIFAWVRNRIHNMLGNVKSGWFFVHDEICNTGIWSNTEGPISNLQASTIAMDILISDGWPILARPVWVATFLFGGGKAKKNGMWRVKNGS